MKYTRFLVGLLALLCVMLFQVVPTTQAKMQEPHPVSCTSTSCQAYKEFTQGNNGLQSSFTITNPTLNTGDSWIRNIEIQSRLKDVRMVMGLEKDGSFAGSAYCSSNTRNTLYLFYYYHNNGNNTGGSNCIGVASGDVGVTLKFEIGFYVSNGGGMFFSTDLGGYCFSGCFVSGWGQSYSYADMFENYEGTVTGTQVAATNWEFNQYDTTNAGWLYFALDPGTNVASNPAQMYWTSGADPANSTTGGELNSCVKSTGTTC